jgi:hypothetical protein
LELCNVPTIRSQEPDTIKQKLTMRAVAAIYAPDPEPKYNIVDPDDLT